MLHPTELHYFHGQMVMPFILFDHSLTVKKIKGAAHQCYSDDFRVVRCEQSPYTDRKNDDNNGGYY